MADIGGTHSRFAAFNLSSEKITLIPEVVWLATQQIDSFSTLIIALKEHHLDFNDFQEIVLAFPGIIDIHSQIKMVNIKWKIDLVWLQQNFPQVHFLFLNDFAAQAYGCITEAVSKALTIQRNFINHEDLAVIGAGTGLGHGALKKTPQNHYYHLASEAGQIIFPFTGKIEIDYQNFLQRSINQPLTNDLIVSGRGLNYLHRFLTDQDLSPAEICQSVNHTSETMRWFTRFLARCCRNYSLNILPFGGKLFLSGGVVAKNPMLINQEIFMQEFNYQISFNLLEHFSIFINTNEEIGLWGAAEYAKINNHI